MPDSDTIAAISTSLGNSGIHIIRVSGEETFDIIEKIFKKGKSKRDFHIDEIDSHTIHYGYIIYDGQCVDEVMLSIFKKPNSYTTDNLAEINCHGSSYIAKKILEIIVKLGGRLAEPGEFSKRAFLNGRIDLSQAEAVMNLIRSKNDYSLKSSMSQMRGDLSSKIKYVREKLLHDVAYIESALDDPEHYDLTGYNSVLEANVKECINVIDKLVSSFTYGKVISEGIDTVIIGKPNAGKSSLMNNFLNEDRAIVTDIPGTTRDVIEYSVNIGDININLIDTAGIHDTSDKIEQIGIEKTLKYLEDAQLVLYVIDISDEIADDDIELYKKIKDTPHIVILNKSDKNISPHFDAGLFNESVCVNYSTLDKTGFDILVSEIKKMFLDNVIDIENEIYITSVRHLELLGKARESLMNVLNEIDCDLSEDILTIDIMDSYEYLGLIIGETVNEDLFDKIFSEFCMGK
ncbi:MAG: tRNA uridine-5-carboxymethylaminomethyl(34) synthesis GTPase MnmE [Lachnospiraceae bacterium]|nr:tRNA uridine-5-carboxymethylaminomethyl(34) synthesis GTPase MnmE [Lachnospiraceae bacterium]